MSETFDPYRKWLGIPPDEQPPDQYRLLGIGRFEEDADTISNAADRQMAHVRTFQTGPHSALSQKLLNEIAAARICLLDGAKKAEYDARLRTKLAVAAGQTTPLPPTPSIAPTPPSASATPRHAEPSLPPTIARARPAAQIQIRTARAKRKRSPATGLAIGGAVLLAAIAATVAVIGRNGGESRPAPSLADRPRPATLAKKPTSLAAKSAAPEPARPNTALPDTAAPKSTKSRAGGSSFEQPATSPALPTSQTKLEIVEARFGSGDRWEDVTERVQSLVADERLLVTVAGDLYQGLPDPAFGVVKTTQIRFRAAGREGTGSFADGELVYLDGHLPQERQPSPHLQVLDARYGAGTKWIDVLPKLRRWIHGDRLAVRVDNLVQSDPVPNARKLLFLRYRTPDGEFFAHAWDREAIALDVRPIATSGNSTDLIAAADPEFQPSGKRWHKDGAVFVGPSNEPGNLTIPSPLADDYLLMATIEGTPLASDVGLTLPVAGHRVQLLIDGSWRSASGLQWVDGAVVTQNAATCRGTIFEPGQATFVQSAVGRSKIYATCNGRVIVDWQGDPARLSVPEPESTDQQTIVVRSMGIPWRLSQLRVAPLAAEKPHEIGDTPKVVNLLDLIDLKLDTVWGRWETTAQGLLMPAAEAVRVQVPYSPGDDYELRLVAARKSGGGGLFIGLVVDGRQTMVVIDGGGGSGLHLLDGKTVEQNDTRHGGTVFADERPKTIVCTVHSARVRVAADGQTLIDWHGDPRRLSIEPRMALPDELGLALAGWNTSYLLSVVELRPLPPEKRELAIDPAQPEKPRSLAELSEKPKAENPAADKRLPVPVEKELAAAEKKVAELYDPQWKSAKDLAERLAAARKLYGDGARTNDNPTLRYALLREASRRAIGLGEAATVYDAIDRLGRDFQVDPLAEKLAALSETLEKARLPNQVWTLAMNALLLADRASLDDRFDEARKFASLAGLAGRKIRNHDLVNYAERRQSLVRGRQDRHTKLEKALAQLHEKPDDEAANLVAGVALCLPRGDWQRGLPLLARSGNARLAEIAKLESGAQQDASQRAALVDAWLAEAPKQTGAMRTEYDLQAKYWLERGLPADAPAPDVARKRALDKLAALPGISLARVVPGLDMAMFDGADMQLFRARRVADGLCHDFGFSSPHPSVGGDNFSVRWTGWLKPPLPGKYAIKTGSDDGIRLRINGNLVVDHWHRGAGDELAEVSLTDQIQPLRVEFNDTGATAAVWVQWALKDLSDFQFVPAEAFFHDPAVAH